MDFSLSQVANIKHKNNKQTSRKQKEETPPVPVVEEETKEEKAKLVPTSEQLRLAQITQSQDNTMDPQRKAKISQVIDITGKSEDEVATALFDCGWDAARAIDMLLEEGGADGMGSWEAIKMDPELNLHDKVRFYQGEICVC